MALQQRPHLLELFCQGVRVRGTAVTHLRVSDMMNEADVWMNMTAVELWPTSAGEHDQPERHESGRLRKSGIELASETGESPRLDPEDGGFLVAKTPRRMLVLTGNYAIRGDLHVSNQTDVRTTLDVFRGRFLPLTTASVSSIDPEQQSRQPFARKFLLVNMEMINLICDAAEALPPVFFPD